MISPSDRESLIKYRIDQAVETIELTSFLISNDKLIMAVNRIYYGMFYSLTALALKYQFETSKHTQLIGWFNKEFISNKKVDTRYGRILRNAYQNRTKGDYDAFVTFAKEEVEEMQKEMKEFILEIQKMLQ